MHVFVGDEVFWWGEIIGQAHIVKLSPKNPGREIRRSLDLINRDVPSGVKEEINFCWIPFFVRNISSIFGGYHQYALSKSRM